MEINLFIKRIKLKNLYICFISVYLYVYVYMDGWFTYSKPSILDTNLKNSTIELIFLLNRSSMINFIKFKIWVTWLVLYTLPFEFLVLFYPFSECFYPFPITILKLTFLLYIHLLVFKLNCIFIFIFIYTRIYSTRKVMCY